MVTKSAIARATGVSRTSVSLVLNNVPGARIGPSTRNRIRRLARELGYRPRPAAPRETDRTAIAYVMCGEHLSRQFDAPWHAQLLCDLERLASADHRAVRFLTANEHEDRIQQVLGLLEQAQPAGVVLDGLVPVRLAEQALQRGLCCVAAGFSRATAPDSPVADRLSWLDYDLEHTVDLLLRWLNAQHARRVALILPTLAFTFSQRMLEAYRKALGALGLPYDPALVRVGRSTDTLQALRDLEAVELRYDGLLFEGVGQARLALQCIETGLVRPSTERGEIPIATVGDPKSASDAPELAVAGVSGGPFVAALYDLLLSRIQTTSSRPRHDRAPVHFREGRPKPIAPR